MKASILLDWIIDYEVCKEGNGKVQIADTDEFLDQKDFIESFFGCAPDKNIPEGNYLYVYSDTINEDFYVRNSILPFADLTLDFPNDGFKIYLFRIED